MTNEQVQKSVNDSAWLYYISCNEVVRALTFVSDCDAWWIYCSVDKNDGWLASASQMRLATPNELLQL